MKKYCPVCNCEQEIQLVKKQETYQIKGEPITIYATICTCSHCGEEIVTFDYDDENLKEAYRAYRHNRLVKGLSFSADRYAGYKWSGYNRGLCFYAQPPIFSE